MTRRITLLWYLLTSLCLMAGQIVHAQLAAPVGMEPLLRLTHLTSEDGMSDDVVTAILQDRRGFMWIGTENGLNRFDGYRFTTYKFVPHDPHSLSSNHVVSLLEDTEGQLWVTTYGGGVNRFDPQTDTFIRYQHDPVNPHSLGGNIIFSGFQDSNGDLWFGGPPFSGLNKLNSGTNTVTCVFSDPRQPDGLMPKTGIWQIDEDREGNLWFAAAFVLSRCDPQIRRCVHYRPHPEERHLNVLFRDQAGTWWLGGRRGLYRFDPRLGEFTIYQPDQPIHVDAIYEYPFGTLWVGTDQDGLYRFEPSSGQFTAHYLPDPLQRNSLSHRDVNALYADESGMLWIGTRAGLNLMDDRQQQFQHYQADFEGGTGTNIPTLHGDRSESVWFGAEDALIAFEPKTGEVTPYHIPRQANRRTPDITAVYSDSHGNVWVGVAERLYRFDRATEMFTSYDVMGGIPHQGPPIHIFSLYEDEFGTLWIAAEMGGLFRFDPEDETFRAYVPQRITRLAERSPQFPDQERDVAFSPPNGEIGDNPHTVAGVEVRAITGDRAGHLWIGYQTGILSRLDLKTGRFTHYVSNPDDPASLNSGWIETIYHARSGLVWIGSRNGLTRFDPQTEHFHLYTEQDGLPSAFVTGILEDADGNLWLSTHNGIAQFDPDTETFHAYNEDDGVGGRAFNSRAAYQSANGRLFFGGQHGLTAFSPKQISENPYAPPVVLTELLVNHLPVTPGQDSALRRPIWDTTHLTFPPDVHSIAFEFAALSYAAPWKNRYRYRLEGLDTTWNDVDSTRRFASYTHLEARNYVFRVQAANNSGVWSDHEATLNITMLPPWWKTLWFRGTLFVLIAGLVIGGYRVRIRVIHRRNLLLEAQVQERTRELSEKTRELEQSHKQLEKAKNAAETANHAKSTFLAHMSHELRTPLNAILGFARILAHTLHSPKEQEHLTIISRNGEHLLTLINQVLDFSKIEAGRITLDEKPVDLFRLLRELDEMFRLRTNQKRLQLIFKHAPGVPQHIRTDGVKLRQILINLLNNAIKFTKEGEIRLAVSSNPLAVSPDALKTDHCLLFTVQDTGPGIAPEEMDIIFKAFEQTATGRQAQEGTGLGLPISRTFAQLMGGDIEVESEVGRGTRFTLTIQVAVEEERTELPNHPDAEFVYQEERQAAGGGTSSPPIDITPEALAALPEEWVNMLKQGAEEARISLLAEVIELIRERDDRLADTLAQLAEEFDYDEIIRYIRKAGRYPIEQGERR